MVLPIAIRSRDRVSGSLQNYTVRLTQPIPPGMYRCRLRSQTNIAGEVRLRWGRIMGISTAPNDGYHTVALIQSSTVYEGDFTVEDPTQEISVQYRTHAGAVSTVGSDHPIMLFLELI